METTMYDTLLQLPLFQGLRKEDFTHIIEKVKFNFHHCENNEIIVKQGDACNQLIFLLDGEIIAQTNDEAHNFQLSETIHSPFLIEPYSLFGMYTRYNATYLAKGKISLLTIEKTYLLRNLNNFDIFRLNFYNILSNRAQTVQWKLWNAHSGSLKEKLANFFVFRCIRNSGEKRLHIGMEDLSKLIGETRINVSKVLNDLREKDVIQLRRKEIYIPEMKDFLEALQ